MDTEHTAKDVCFPFCILEENPREKMSSAFGAGKEEDPCFSCETSADSWLLWMGAGEGLGDT